MKNWRNPLRFAKCVFFTLLAASAVFLLKSALVFQDDEEKNSSYLYMPNTFSDDYTRQMMRSNFHSCITQPSKTFCVEPGKLLGYGSSSSIETEKHFSADNFTAKTNKLHQKGISPRHLHPIHATYMAFTRLCQVLHIKPVLIEPSVIFCMLNQDSRTLLMKRRFNISSWTGGENVLTFAINQSESSQLSYPSAKKELLISDFKYWSIDMDESDRSSFKVHHFFIRQRIVIHAVVFYRRNKYLWHGGINMLPNEVLNVTPKENLLFSESEEIYERFVPIEVPAEEILDALYVPSDPRLFLHQIVSSKFLYCNSSNALYANKTKERSHGQLSHKKFVRLTFVALQELKAQLYPELMVFWIVGGTLLGWYRECGIIPYTSDVDFSAWADDIDDAQKLAKKFMKNKHLRLREVMGLQREALEYKFSSGDLKVDLFFTYDDGEHYWVSGHRPSKGYYFPYYYPKFTLCSADLLGHKVQVPCDTLKMILADYGTQWDKPISSWNYEISPKNMGKKRYWHRTERPLVYFEYQ